MIVQSPNLAFPQIVVLQPYNNTIAYEGVEGDLARTGAECQGDVRWSPRRRQGQTEGLNMQFSPSSEMRFPVPTRRVRGAIVMQLVD